MRMDQFTVKAQEAIAAAQTAAERADHPEVMPEHLLQALVTQEGGVVPAALAKMGVNTNAILQDTEKALGALPHTQGAATHVSPRLDAVLKSVAATDPTILVVHDTGGMVGTAWAAANLGRLRGMVVTNTVATEGFPWFAVARQWGDTSLLGRLRSTLGMAALGIGNGALFKRIFSARCPQLDAEQLQRFATSFALNRTAKKVTLRQFRQILQPGFFDGFTAMRERIVEAVPCRTLWGDQDSFIPVQYAQQFGGRNVTILPDAGHWVALTATDALAAEVNAVAVERRETSV